MTADTPAGEDRHAEIPLDRLEDYPALAKCVAAWREAKRRGALPAAIPIDAVPEEVRPYTMLLDFLPETRDARVRMVGEYIGERARFDMAGHTLRGFFEPADAAIVYEGLSLAARTRMPTLARRDYVPIDGRRCRYVRLILPLAGDGENVDGFFKTVEPASFETFD